MSLPTIIIAGDTFKYTHISEDYQSPDYSLRIALQGPDVFVLTGTVSSSSPSTFDFYASFSATKEWLPGKYRYAVIAYNDDDEYTIESGQVQIDLRADLLTDTDVRTHNQKVLDAIRAVLENRATLDQEETQINNRSLKRTPIKDLLLLEQTYADRVKQDATYGLGYRKSKNKVKVVM